MRQPVGGEKPRMHGIAEKGQIRGPRRTGRNPGKSLKSQGFNPLLLASVAITAPRGIPVHRRGS